MDDAAVVGVLERVGELDAEAEHAGERRRVASEVGGQQPALDQLHRDVDLSFGFSHVVDCADVRMIQRGCGSGFVQQSASGAVVAEGFGGEDFERDVTIEPGVARAKYDPHSAFAQLVDDSIWTECFADHRRGLFWASARPRRSLGEGGQPRLGRW